MVKAAKFIFGLTVFICFDGWLRYLNAGSDFVNYELALHLSYADLMHDFYYYKEPALWLIQKLLFDIFNSSMVVWISIDLILYLFCLNVATKLRVDHLYVLVYFLSFYSIIGLFNTYRQFLALAIVGWAGLLYGVRATIVVAIFFHWASVTSLLIEKIKIKEGVVVIVIGLIFYFYLDPMTLLSDRASVHSGNITVPIYCAMLIFLLMNIFKDLREPRFLLLAVLLVLMQMWVDSSYMERIYLGLFQLMMPLAIKVRLHKRFYMWIFYLFSLMFPFVHPSILTLMGFFVW